MFNTLWSSNHKIMETKKGGISVFFALLILFLWKSGSILFLSLDRLREFAKWTCEKRENLVRSKLAHLSGFYFGRVWFESRPWHWMTRHEAFYSFPQSFQENSGIVSETIPPPIPSRSDPVYYSHNVLTFDARRLDIESHYKLPIHGACVYFRHHVL